MESISRARSLTLFVLFDGVLSGEAGGVSAKSGHEQDRMRAMIKTSVKPVFFNEEVCMGVISRKG
jgi:hypothetical protein